MQKFGESAHHIVICIELLLNLRSTSGVPPKIVAFLKVWSSRSRAIRDAKPTTVVVFQDADFSLHKIEKMELKRVVKKSSST